MMLLSPIDLILGPWMDELKKKFKNTFCLYNGRTYKVGKCMVRVSNTSLWLDHTMGSTNDIVRIPQQLIICFREFLKLYNQCLKMILHQYSLITEVMGTLYQKGKSNVALTGSDITDFNRLNFTKLKLPLETISETSLKPYMFVTNSEDSIDYYKKLNRAKYYVTIANRVGQAA